jgi:hypothetical protein
MRVRKAMAALAALCGLGAIAAQAAELRPERAVRHIGETATVCGVVAGAKFDVDLPLQPTFLDFVKPYPDQVFMVVILGKDRAKFGTPEVALRGKRVCVTGKIEQKDGPPEIVVNDKSQLGE